jgi:hypothetical protein
MDGRIKLRGVGSLSELAAAYRMVVPDEVDVPFNGDVRTNGLRTIGRFPGSSFPWAALASGWVDYATNYPVPGPMAERRAGGG